MNAQEKRDQQQAEYEQRRAAEAVESARYKLEWPALAKEQRRKAIEQLDKGVAEANGNKCDVFVWDLDRRLEASVIKHLKKQGFTLLIRYVSQKEEDYDGRPTGRTVMGIHFEIRW